MLSVKLTRSAKLKSLLTQPSARNNMRAMMKGDQAFFYHSNCKVPGIVGIMEIVQEHTVDGQYYCIIPLLSKHD